MGVFDVFANDTIDLIKADGTKFEGLKVNLKNGVATFFSAKHPVDAGDKIVRYIAHGRTEQYEVTDPGYDAGMPPHFPEGYKARLRRI